ncbi:MAG: hypothetical protein ACRD4O_05800, partial [Bryobacteraceae bacterium]
MSVSLPDKGSARRIEKGIRKRLKSDPRYLRIDIQCEPDRPCWQARILWGDAKECLEHPRLIFGAGEQTAKVVVGRISEELDRLGLSPVQPQD